MKKKNNPKFLVMNKNLIYKNLHLHSFSIEFK